MVTWKKGKNILSWILTNEYLISGSLEQDLVPKITKFHIVKMRHLYVSNVNLIRNWPPNNKQVDIGPRNPQFNVKKLFFCNFFNNKLVLIENSLIFHCDFFRALFIVLILVLIHFHLVFSVHADA